MVSTQEKELYLTKWYDYREISPEGCDLLFKKYWLESYNGFMDDCKIDFMPDGKGGWKLPQVVIQNESEKITKLRIMADKHCIPYKMFWNIAFKVISEFDYQVNGIDDVYFDTFIRSSIIDEYNLRKSISIPLSELITAKSYVGSPAQVAYFDYIEKEVKRKYPLNWEHKLAILSTRGYYIYTGVNHVNNELMI